MGEQETVQGPIEQGMQRLEKEPEKYLALTYQCNMVDWAESQQKYTLIHREGTVGYKPKNVSPNGPFAAVFVRYERCRPYPGNELPPQYRDRYTDNMTYEGRKLHGPDNKPIMPGRGWVVATHRILRSSATSIHLIFIRERWETVGCCLPSPPWQSSTVQ